MATALIGFTGFVGGNIARQKCFDYKFNSKNIEKIVEEKFDLVVCAGVPAVKWLANKKPEEDRLVIQNLIDIYGCINTKRFVLVSTVDVYPTPVAVNEKTNIDSSVLQPYGLHRLLLERELSARIDNMHIIRLPALFGVGLKKNIIYDMLCSNMLAKINLESSFQWYPLSRIWQDIDWCIQNEVELLNLAVEPIKTQLIKDLFFPSLNVGSEPVYKSSYDMQTIYGSSFDNGDDVYVLGVDDILSEMSIWLETPEVKCG